MKKCVWQDTEERYVLFGQIAGHIALWAIQQSPIYNPEHLNDAIKDILSYFGNNDEQWAPGEWGEYYTCASLRSEIEKIISKSEVMKSWNIPQDYTNNDFIDLDALARNVAHSVWLQILYDDDVVGFKESTHEA